MDHSNDEQLLRDYTEDRVESAFTELVRRHVDFVYSAALRMVRHAPLAEDVTQAVFVALAKNARKLIGCPALEGWLHGTTRNLAANAVRAEVRRRTHEQQAATMKEMLTVGADANWEQVAPYLDGALRELSEPERDALLLRYFKNQDLRTVGATLGISNDAAQKRVSRALERLRQIFAKRGVTIGSAGLVVIISANAVQAAPATLAPAIYAAALQWTMAAASGAVATTAKTIAMTSIQKAVVGTTLAVALGAGVLQTHRIARLFQVLEKQKELLATQIEQLQREREDAKTRLALLSEQEARLKSAQNLAELVKLRREVGLLPSQSDVADSNSVRQLR